MMIITYHNDRIRLNGWSHRGLLTGAQGTMVALIREALTPESLEEWLKSATALATACGFQDEEAEVILAARKGPKIG